MQDARPGVAGCCLFSLGNWRFVTLKKKKELWGGEGGSSIIVCTYGFVKNGLCNLARKSLSSCWIDNAKRTCLAHIEFSGYLVNSLQECLEQSCLAAKSMYRYVRRSTAQTELALLLFGIDESIIWIEFKVKKALYHWSGSFTSKALPGDKKRAEPRARSAIKVTSAWSVTGLISRFDFFPAVFFSRFNV